MQLTEYFQGEVIAGSWSAFEAWIQAGENDAGSASGRDSETLTQAHKRYLKTLGRALLLHDQQFTRSLRQLLGRVDHIVGLFQRLEVVVKALIASESAEASGPDHLQREEQSLAADLRKAGLNDVLSKVTQRLKDIEMEQLETGIQGLNTDFDGADDNQTRFTPWFGAGISILTMRLEIARAGEADFPSPR